MIVPTSQLYRVAHGNFAVGAYNINNAEQTIGLFKGCLASQAPFIVQVSRGARKFTDKRMLEAIIRAAEQIFPDAIFAVHPTAFSRRRFSPCISTTVTKRPATIASSRASTAR